MHFEKMVFVNFSQAEVFKNESTGIYQVTKQFMKDKDIKSTQ